MQDLRQIRTTMGYSIRQFAELLGIKCHSTYQHWESNFRPCPDHVRSEAIAAYHRDKRFFSEELPASIDANIKGAVPNEARKGEW